ncbi:MAG: MCP four helix bundle domain-containing protein, partial [Pelobacteraceae bacterium]
MSFYANLKIRDKLIFGFATVVFMALAIGIFGFFQIHKLELADTVLFKKGVKPVEYIGDIAADFQRLRSNIRDFILAKDKNRHDYYQIRITKFREEIDASVGKLETSLPDVQAEKLFAQLEHARSNYTPHIKRILEFSNIDNDKEVIAYIKSDAVYAAEHAEIDAIENLQTYLVANAEVISEQNSETATSSGVVMLGLAFGVSLLAAIMTILITRSITVPLGVVLGAVRSQHEGSKEKARLLEAISEGNYDLEVLIADPLTLDADQSSMDEAGMLLRAIVAMSEIQYSLDLAFAGMTDSLRHNQEQQALHNWFKNGQYELSTILRGDKSTSELTNQALTFLTEYLRAGVGVFYIFDESDNALHIAASYALTQSKRCVERIALGEGLAGQAALEKQVITLNKAPADYLRISSGLGESEPAHIVVVPLLHNEALAGLLEIGSFSAFKENDLEFLKQIVEALAIALSVNRSRQQVNELLEQTQSQTEELRVQQEELQQSNEELEERAQMLEQQREQIRAKNREVEEASRKLQRKADELEQVSTYKSEFMANMSHELRTPLNSLMILSSLLRDNREGNLSVKQVEFAATINGAGRDLLNLINDILDLSKIESGHMEFHYEALSLPEICTQLENVFNPITGDKKIGFTVALDESTPETFTGDSQRTLQILNNLLSNA